MVESLPSFTLLATQDLGMRVFFISTYLKESPREQQWRTVAAEVYPQDLAVLSSEIFHLQISLCLPYLKKFTSL